MGMLRLLLALSVVMNHGLTTFLGSKLIDAAGAVWIFFVISGFLITIGLQLKYQSQQDGLVHFYWNRALRLFPMYWVWLFITLMLYWLLPPHYFTRGFQEDHTWQTTGFWKAEFHFASIGTLISVAIANMTGLFSDAFLALGFNKTSGALIANPNHDQPIWAMAFIAIGQYWSIGVELVFYAVAPWFSKNLVRMTCLFGLSVSGYLENAWQFICSICHLPPVVAFIKAPQYLWIFMLGVALAQVYLRSQKGITKSLGISLALVVGMYICIFLRKDVLFASSSFPWWHFVGLTAVTPLLFAFTNANRFDRFVGDLSYPVYINHWIMIQILSSFVTPNGLLYAVLSIALAVLTLYAVDLPCRRWKFYSKARPSSSITDTALANPRPL